MFDCLFEGYSSTPTGSWAHWTSCKHRLVGISYQIFLIILFCLCVQNFISALKQINFKCNVHIAETYKQRIWDIYYITVANKDLWLSHILLITWEEQYLNLVAEVEL